jgi:FMN-dependent NADH-azoreductase
MLSKGKMMPTLLQIDSSPLETSVSRELSREFARTWLAAHPGGEVIYRDLAANAPPPIDANWIAASYADPAQQTPEQVAQLELSEELISELQRADEYVIGVAMHNFGVPAGLKLWIDQVSRRGKTFSYGETGPRGLLEGKKATIVAASGGVYAEGSPAAPMNHAEPYLRTILSFWGVTDVKVITAGGTAKLMMGKVDRPEFLKPSLEQVRSAAA